MVRRLANDCLLLSRARPDQVADHYEPGGNADPRLQYRPGLLITYGTHQLQPRAYRSLCVIFVSLRLAEVDQHAVAHVLRHDPAEAAHSFGDAVLICRN